MNPSDPDPAQPPPPGVFRLGLVMAGAISAGAYSAGVVDFLMEALDEYELARTTGKTSDGEVWDGPTHAVKVPVMAGASAGGMTAAIAAMQMFSRFEPFHGKAVAPGLNRLYASWVDEIDATDLLSLSDLGVDAKLRSVLCSEKLERIVHDTVTQTSKDRTRGWVGDDDGALAVVTTVTNLGGIPYQFPLRGTQTSDAYGMLNHGDSLSFRLGLASPPVQAGFESISLAHPDQPALGRFTAAALATGAFPIGLAARPITRDFADYEDDQRIGYDALEKDSLVFRPVPPKKPVPREMREFVGVDGGVVDNEPLELARRYLLGRPDPNPKNRNGKHTSYAVLLIDPFPNRPVWPSARGKDWLSEIVFPLVSTLVDQARFKPQELALAMNESVFSRYVIGPVTEDPANPAARELPIACGALGGFSGFLHRSFRHHDYMLGRRNAQAFLRWHLCLPESNGLVRAFAQGPSADRWFVRDVSNLPKGTTFGDNEPAGTPLAMVSPVATPDGSSPATERAVPIIPLTRRMRRPIVISPGDRPRPKDLDLDALEERVSQRVKRVVSKFIDDENVAKHISWWVGPPLKLFLPGPLTNRAVAALKEARNQIAKAFP